MRSLVGSALGALVLVVAGVVGGGACGGKRVETSHEQPGLIHERVWVEKIPTRRNELFHVFVAFEEEGERFGVFAHASQFKLNLEVFEHRRNGDRLALMFPQDGRKAKMKFSIRRCNEVPEADLCLHVDENPWGGPKKYYGIKPDSARAFLPSQWRVR
jgi:hypothetical protein